MSKKLGATDFTPFNDFFPFSQELDVGNPGPFHNLLSSSIADANLGNGCHFAGAIRKTPDHFSTGSISTELLFTFTRNSIYYVK